MKRVLAIILGGGAGTRLYPLTKMRAKPAVPLAGKYRLIDIPISNCINSGINKMYVLTQFNSASLNRHLTQSYNLSAGFGQGFVEVLAAQQTPESPSWFEGTADAVRKYQWLFQEWDVDHYLILSGDQLYRMDYSAFVDHHISTGADVSIGALPVDAAQAEGFGLMHTNDHGRIQEFREKPKGEALKAMWVDTSRLGLGAEEALKRPYLASMGIYVFSRDTLFDLLAQNPTATDFGKELIPTSLQRGDHLQSYLFDDYWEDIGTIKSFFEANLGLAHSPPRFEFYDPETPIYTSPRFLPPAKVLDCKVSDAIISHGCYLERCTVDNAIVGLRSRVDAGAVIRDAMLIGADYYESAAKRAEVVAGGGVPIGVGADSVVSNAIVDKNARIGKKCTIVNKAGVDEADRESDGFFIRSGIVVVLRNATLPDGTTI